MGEAFSAYRGRGVDSVAFGDLFLQDIRAYRQRPSRKHDMAGPVSDMGKETSHLIREFLDLGFKTVVCAWTPRNSIRHSSAG